MSIVQQLPLPSGKPSSGTWRQIQHTVSTLHYTIQRTQSAHKMMTLCDTRRELNDSYPIPRVIFKERPSPLIPTPTQSRWPIIEREAWAIMFAISLRLLTTLQPTTYCLPTATSYLILKTRLLISLPPPLFPVCSGLKNSPLPLFMGSTNFAT